MSRGEEQTVKKTAFPHRFFSPPIGFSKDWKDAAIFLRREVATL